MRTLATAWPPTTPSSRSSSGVARPSLFFQAEAGIRASKVTGVQTCALPIFQLGFRLTGFEQAAVENRDRHVHADCTVASWYRRVTRGHETGGTDDANRRVVE